MRACLSILVFLCAFALNPAYVVGCGGGDGEFDFSEQEMLTLSVRTTGSYPFTVGSTEYVLKLDLKPSSRATTAARGSLFAASAHACGTRQIFATASACVDSSEIRMEGTMMLELVGADGTERALESPLALEGRFSVYGSSLDNGVVDLRADDVQVVLDSDGESFTLASFKLSDVDEVISFKGE
jgi:hypothetical protein